jgi:hypothetical protein
MMDQMKRRFWIAGDEVTADIWCPLFTANVVLFTSSLSAGL